MKDALPTLTTQQEDISENEYDHDLISSEPKEYWKRYIDLRRDYIPKLVIIFILSIIVFSIITVPVIYSKYYELIGWTLIGSKGCAFSICFVTGICLTFMSHDLMTFLRRKCKRVLSTWLDHYYIIHKFCGYLLTFYAVVHSICHLSGSFRVISQTNDVDKINSHLNRDIFETPPSYAELLFTTLPGITGLLLLIIILTMAVTSLSCVRHKYFQLFGYTHIILFPIFCILLIIHGLDLWFLFGIPYAIVLITPSFIGQIVQQLCRVFADYLNHFQIVDISVSSDCSYIMIYLSKPEKYKLVHGQYVFLNIATIHPLQWHPFTVASSPSSPYLTLMIKRDGDWTEKLIKVLYQCKCEMMKMSEFSYKDHPEYDVFNLLHDLHQEVPLKDMKHRNSLYYPPVKISKACSTPNDTFIDRKHLVMIGAGSGISPYLPLLEEVIRSDKGKQNKFDFEQAKLVFVAREGEQISWISNYLFHIINSECMIPQLEFNIFITIEKNLQTLPSFLFWRAFLLISLTKQVCRRRKKNVLKSPSFKYDSSDQFINQSDFDQSIVKVRFGRPDFEAILKSMVQPDLKKVYVYSTTSNAMNTVIFDATKSVSKSTGVIFRHIYEATS